MSFVFTTTDAVQAQELRRQLSSSEMDLNQQKSLLSSELSSHDLIIEQLQAEKQALDDKYQHSCHQVGGLGSIKRDGD